MRHRVKAKHFNRDTTGRKALFKNLLIALFEHGAVETTLPRAKQIKRLADKLVYRAQPGTLHSRRMLERFFGTKQVVNNLVDNVAPTMKDRNSGYTRIVPLSRRRGDDASMVKLELVVKPQPKTAKVEKAEKAVKAEATEVTSEAKPAAKKAPVKAKKPVTSANEKVKKPAKKQEVATE